LARRIYQAIRAPGVDKMQMINCTNWIRNNPVTEEDILRARDIFGDDVAYLKGHMTHQKPLKYVDDVISIPSELTSKCSKITLHMDNLIISGRVFLSAIGKPIYYRDAVVIEDKKKTSFYKALDVMLRRYNRAGYTVTTVSCDNEFRSLMDEVQDQLNIDMDYTNPGDHESSAKRNN